MACGTADWLAGDGACCPTLFVLDRHGNDLLGRRVPEFLRRGWPRQRAGRVPELLRRTRRALALAAGVPNDETYALSLLRLRAAHSAVQSHRNPIVTALAAARETIVASCWRATCPIRFDTARATRSIAAGDWGARRKPMVARDELGAALDFDLMAERAARVLASHASCARCLARTALPLQIADPLAWPAPACQSRAGVRRIEQETAAGRADRRNPQSVAPGRSRRPR